MSKKVIHKVKFKLIIQSFLCFFLSFLLANPASATLSESVLDFYNLNGIYYYNPAGSNANFGCYSGDIVIAGTTSEEKVWSGLLSFMTPEQAAGAMGNMAHEGNYFNPVQHEVSQMNSYWNSGIDLINDANKAYGIGLIQWSFGRRTRLLQYIQSTSPGLLEYFTHPEEYSVGYNINGNKLLSIIGDAAYDSLIRIELEFLREELNNNSTYRKFFDETTVEGAADYFLDRIEVPADPEASRPIRREDAQKYYDQLINADLTPSSASGCTVSGDFLELVKKYAWPEYHKPDFIEMMPDYAAIVQQRQSEGKWVGGNTRPGIDCGGFVTILMQTSGFEPNYNSGSGGTSVQEPWVKNNGWILLNASENTPVDTNILQAGDVAFTTGHTFVYVGDIEGFDSNIASASYGGENQNSGYWRAPMAGRESLIRNSDGETVRWYRKGN